MAEAQQFDQFWPLSQQLEQLTQRSGPIWRQLFALNKLVEAEMARHNTPAAAAAVMNSPMERPLQAANDTEPVYMPESEIGVALPRAGTEFDALLATDTPDPSTQRTELENHIRQRPFEPEPYVAMCQLAYEQGDSDLFERYVHTLAQLTNASGPLWAQVQPWGQQLVPDSPLFSHNTPTSSVAETSALADIDLNLGEDFEPQQAVHSNDPEWQRIEEKWNLMVAHHEMGELEQAQQWLEELTEEGDDTQRHRARNRLAQLQGGKPAGGTE